MDSGGDRCEQCGEAARTSPTTEGSEGSGQQGRRREKNDRAGLSHTWRMTTRMSTNPVHTSYMVSCACASSPVHSLILTHDGDKETSDFYTMHTRVEQLEGIETWFFFC
jgi:hypothetical protein